MAQAVLRLWLVSQLAMSPKSLCHYIGRARPFWGADSVMEMNEKMVSVGLDTIDNLSAYSFKSLEDRLKQANPRWSSEKIDVVLDTLKTYLNEQEEQANLRERSRTRSRSPCVQKQGRGQKPLLWMAAETGDMDLALSKRAFLCSVP